MGKFKDQHLNGKRSQRDHLSLATLKRCTGDTLRSSPATKRDRRTFFAFRRRAIQSGATHAPDDQFGKVLIWNLSAKSKFPCQDPREVSRVVGYDTVTIPDTFPYRETKTSKVDTSKPIGVVQLFGRCRRCSNCLTFRKSQWIARTRREFEATPLRTWFVTLTMAPEFRTFLDMQARAIGFSQRTLFDAQDDEGKYALRCAALRPEVQKYLKRVRKGVGKLHKPSFRYLCVMEPHKDGFPHLHLIVHETSITHPLTQRLLRSRWNTGSVFRGRITEAKLVKSDEAITYVAKYLGKDLLARPMASLRYGL